MEPSDEHGKTVREGGAATHQGPATVREGGAAPQQGPATVREGGAATVREGGAAPQRGGATVREGPQQAAADAREPWIPDTIASDYRIVRPLLAAGGEANLYVVAPRNSTDTRELVAKVYDEGVDLDEGVLQRVCDADLEHLIQIEDYGQDAGRWWELMEYAEYGSLRNLIEQEGPELPGILVKDILRQLNEALAGLHNLNVEHKDLKPQNVLVRSRTPLQLVITDFGISSLTSDGLVATEKALTFEYAPIEVMTASSSRVIFESTRVDYWSLGMMLVEMLTGAHPYHEYDHDTIRYQLLQNADWLTEDIEDADWLKLCRGLLRRTAENRWTAEHVSKWLADPDDPSLRADEAPEADAVPLEAIINFDGTGYTTPDDLGAALSQDWEKATSFWTRRFADVRTWAFDGLGHPPLGDALTAIDDSDMSLDAQVFSFIYHLAPHAPVRYRDEDISLASLTALVEQAKSPWDDDLAETLVALRQNNILAMAGGLPEREELADVSRRWDDAVHDYARLRDSLGVEGLNVPEPEPDDLSALLAASLPDSPIDAPLRGLARDIGAGDAVHCAWYRDLGAPEDMSPATLAMLPLPERARGARGKKSPQTPPARLDRRRHRRHPVRAVCSRFGRHPLQRRHLLPSGISAACTFRNRPQRPSPSLRKVLSSGSLAAGVDLRLLLRSLLVQGSQGLGRRFLQRPIPLLRSPAFHLGQIGPRGRCSMAVAVHHSRTVPGLYLWRATLVFGHGLRSPDRHSFRPGP